MEVLKSCHVPSMESQFIQAQLRWVGHLARMEDTRIPKAVFFGQLSSGKRPIGRPRLCYKDTLQQNLKTCGITPDGWESANDRSS